MKKTLEPRICVNPCCRKEFVPSRTNNFFCTKQCHRAFSNGLSDEERKTLALNREIKKNDLILATIFRDCSWMNGDRTNISKELFVLRKLKFECYKRIEEVKDEEPIYWMNIFGFQATDKKKKSFALYLRNPKKI